jgi:hypothetical protein
MSIGKPLHPVSTSFSLHPTGIESGNQELMNPNPLPEFQIRWLPSPSISRCQPMIKAYLPGKMVSTPNRVKGRATRETRGKDSSLPRLKRGRAGDFVGVCPNKPFLRNPPLTLLRLPSPERFAQAGSKGYEGQAPPGRGNDVKKWRVRIPLRRLRRHQRVPEPNGLRLYVEPNSNWACF